MEKILFVCTGNTCRSVMAEALFNHLVSKDKALCGKYVAVSAGIYAPSGAPATENTLRVLKDDYGIDASTHKSRGITGEDIDQASLVLTMTTMHREQLVRSFPGAADKIFTLSEYVEDPGTDEPGQCKTGQDFNDPYGMPLDVYSQCAAVINESVKKLISRLRGT